MRNDEQATYICALRTWGANAYISLIYFYYVLALSFKLQLNYSSDLPTRLSSVKVSL